MNEWNHQKKSYFFVYFVEQFHGLNINQLMLGTGALNLTLWLFF